MKLHLILATTENGVIGKDGDMPWSMPADINHFRKITTSGECNHVIMGRKTYDSIGKALPNRENIIITRNRNLEETKYINGEVFNKIEDAINHIIGVEFFLKKEQDVFIIGGANIYDEFIKMDKIDFIHHTLIHAKLEGDTFFHIPEEWSVISEKPYLADENHAYDYTFRVLTKN